jgi:hypothetical protein
LQFVNMAWCPLADSLKRFSKTPLKKQTAEWNIWLLLVPS